MGLRHYESFFMEFRMYWIVNHSLDPTFNLALEEYFSVSYTHLTLPTICSV